MALTDSLAVYYTLNTTSWVDEIGGLNMTSGAGATTTTGKISNGVSLNGTTQYITYNANNSAFDIKGHDSTVQAWIYPTDLSVNRCALSYLNSFADGWGLLIDSADAKPYLYAPVTTGSPAYIKAAWGSAISINTWYHVVAKYINGTSLSIKVNNGSWVTVSDSRTLVTAGLTGFNVGRDIVGGDNRNFAGTIDEVAIWQRALSDAEITLLYNGGAGLAYPLTGGAAGTGRTMALKKFW